MKLVSVLTLAAIIPGIAAAEGSKAQPTSDFGYATVARALESMRAKDGVKTSVQAGWTVIEDPSTLSLWSFTSPGHSAHPAAAHRWIVREGDNLLVQSNLLCEGPKPACDAMAVEFGRLDEAVRESLKRKPPGR
jgi:hypothetical protein